MNNLIRLVKIITAMYQAWKLGDKTMMDELMILSESVPKSKESLVVQDKKVEALLRKLIGWLRDQPDDSNIITSMAMPKIAEIAKLDSALEAPLLAGFDEKMSEDDAKNLIYQIIKELRDDDIKSKFDVNFKSIVRPFMFDGEGDLTKEDWIKLGDLINEKISDCSNQFDRAVVEKASNNDPKALADIINQLKVETSVEGIVKTGLIGFNNALGPDFGLRRGLMYMIEALTNRGKSFSLAHFIASIPLYNKPVLRNKTKIPTVVLMSAEDSLGLIFKRMYEIFVTAKTGTKPDFFATNTNDVVDSP